MTHYSKLSIRVLFAATLVVFAFQLVGNYATRTQPYPALAMPGFPGTPSSDGEIDWNVPEVTVEMSDGSARSVTFEQILPTDTGVLPSAVFRSKFGTDRFVANPEIVAWLQYRVTQLFPGADIAGLRIVWLKAKYNINTGGGNGPVLEPVETINVDFSGAR